MRPSYRTFLVVVLLATFVDANGKLQGKGKTIINSIGMKLTLIKAGTFRMGIPAADGGDSEKAVIVTIHKKGLDSVSVVRKDGKDFHNSDPSVQEAEITQYVQNRLKKLEPLGLRLPRVFLLAAHDVDTKDVERVQNAIRIAKHAQRCIFVTHFFAPDTLQHQVRISRDYYLGVTEVTQGQWKAVMGTRPWKGKTYIKEGPAYAATHVSWDDSVAFCKRLTEKEGVRYRLPTEAEWECACRAGTTTKYSFGDDEKNLSNYAWWGGIVGGGTAKDEKYVHQVAMKSPNPWGLYDMHGNAWEWCQDRYGPYTYRDQVKDPVGPLQGSKRLIRGGAWYWQARACRSAFRSGASPTERGRGLGFRVSCQTAE